MKKTILITGAAKRIGASLSLQFANLGYNILIHYNSSGTEAKNIMDKINSNNGKAQIFQADLSKEIEIKKMFEFAKSKFGRVDVLINNAGCFHQKTELENIDILLWNTTMNINLTAQMLTAKEFAKQDIETGKIINFSSLGGIKVWDRRIPYNVSKAAVIQLTKALARELAPRIAVNCICPGIVKIDENETLAVTTNKIPMQRYATIEDIWEVVNFFTSSSNYITGQVLTVDGGMNLL